MILSVFFCIANNDLNLKDIDSKDLFCCCKKRTSVIINLYLLHLIKLFFTTI